MRTQHHDLELVDTVPPWFCPTEPEPVYDSADAQAFWDVPLYADHVVVKANRIDAGVVDHKRKMVTILEMSCPCVDNRTSKTAQEIPHRPAQHHPRCTGRILQRTREKC